jgi:hypothetical protein
MVRELAAATDYGRASSAMCNGSRYPDMGHFVERAIFKMAGYTELFSGTVAPMAAQYRCSVDILTSPPASSFETTDCEVFIRAATAVCVRCFFSRSVCARVFGATPLPRPS